MQIKPPCGKASHVDPAVQGWERQGSKRSSHNSPAAGNKLNVKLKEKKLPHACSPASFIFLVLLLK